MRPLINDLAEMRKTECALSLSGRDMSDIGFRPFHLQETKAADECIERFQAIDGSKA